MAKCEDNSTSELCLETVLGNSSQQRVEDCFDDKYARMAKTTACITILLVTIVLNSLVIYPVYKYKKMRKNINYFIVNMAISDILLALLTNIIIVEQMVSGDWHWKIQGAPGRITCKMMSFMATMLLLVSPNTLFFMTLERYRGVTSTTALRSMSRSMRWCCISMCWIIPSILYAVELYRVDLWYINEIPYCIVTKNLQDIIYLICLFAFCVILYIAVFLLGFLTLRKLKKSEQLITIEEICQSKRRTERIRSAVRMVLCSLCSFILLSTPYHVFILLDKSYPEIIPCKPKINLFFVFRYLISLNSALSPCIYFIFIKDFRTFVRGVYSTRKRRETSLKTELCALQSNH